MSRTDTFARLLSVANLDRLVQRTWRGLLILNYHRIGEPGVSDDPDLFSCRLEEFDQHLALLANRFEIVAAGNAELAQHRPARRVAITFDDGYADQMPAAAALAARGLAGSFFICTGFVDDPHHAWWDEIAWLTADLPPHDLPPGEWLPAGLAVAGRSRNEIRRLVNAAFKQRAGDRGEEFLDWLAAHTGRPRLARDTARQRWMSWVDVRRLAATGMEIGGHSVTHPVLATLTRERQRAEIAGSVRRLREELHMPVDTFSYPVGASDSVNAETTAILAEVGIRRAFSFCGGVNHRRRWAPYNVRRAGVFRHHTPSVVRAMTTVPGILAAERRHA